MSYPPRQQTLLCCHIQQLFETGFFQNTMVYTLAFQLFSVCNFAVVAELQYKEVAISLSFFVLLLQICTQTLGQLMSSVCQTLVKDLVMCNADPSYSVKTPMTAKLLITR